MTQPTHSASTLPGLHRAAAARGPFTDVFGITHPGHRRDENQDHFMVLELERRVRAPQSSLGAFDGRAGAKATLLMVADGMGGHANGELASAVTVDTIADYAMRHIPIGDGVVPELVRAGFQRAALECQRRMREVATQKGQPTSLGTTLTALYAHHGAVALAHVGDSRAYGLRDGALHQLTTDHTIETAARASGATQIAPRFAHALTNAIGGSDEDPKVEGPSFELREGDRYLLCSDGLTKELSDEAIQEHLARGSAEEIATRLLQSALAGEASDNVTVVVAIV